MKKKEESVGFTQRMKCVPEIRPKEYAKFNITRFRRFSTKSSRNTFFFTTCQMRITRISLSSMGVTQLTSKSP